MINPFKDVDWHPDVRAKRKFATSLILGFPVLALVLILVGRLGTGHWHVEKPLWIAGIGMGLGVVFWVIPAIAHPFYVVWYALACTIGLFLSNTILIAFYLIVVSVTGLIMRSLGRSPLSKGFNRSADSYWKDLEPISDVRRYYRQF